MANKGHHSCQDRNMWSLKVSRRKFQARKALGQGHCRVQAHMALGKGHCQVQARMALGQGHCRVQARMALGQGHCQIIRISKITSFKSIHW